MDSISLNLEQLSTAAAATQEISESRTPGAVSAEISLGFDGATPTTESTTPSSRAATAHSIAIPTLLPITPTSELSDSLTLVSFGAIRPLNMMPRANPREFIRTNLTRLILSYILPRGESLVRAGTTVTTLALAFKTPSVIEALVDQERALRQRALKTLVSSLQGLRLLEAPLEITEGEVVCLPKPSSIAPTLDRRAALAMLVAPLVERREFHRGLRPHPAPSSAHTALTKAIRELEILSRRPIEAFSALNTSELHSEIYENRVKWTQDVAKVLLPFANDLEGAIRWKNTENESVLLFNIVSRVKILAKGRDTFLLPNDTPAHRETRDRELNKLVNLSIGLGEVYQAYLFGSEVSDVSLQSEIYYKCLLNLVKGRKWDHSLHLLMEIRDQFFVDRALQKLIQKGKAPDLVAMFQGFAPGPSKDAYIQLLATALVQNGYYDLAESLLPFHSPGEESVLLEHQIQSMYFERCLMSNPRNPQFALDFASRVSLPLTIDAVTILVSQFIELGLGEQAKGLLELVEPHDEASVQQKDGMMERLFYLFLEQDDLTEASALNERILDTVNRAERNRQIVLYALSVNNWTFVDILALPFETKVSVANKLIEEGFSHQGMVLLQMMDATDETETHAKDQLADRLVVLLLRENKISDAITVQKMITNLDLKKTTYFNILCSALKAKNWRLVDDLCDELPIPEMSHYYERFALECMKLGETERAQVYFHRISKDKNKVLPAVKLLQHHLIKASSSTDDVSQLEHIHHALGYLEIFAGKPEAGSHLTQIYQDLALKGHKRVLSKFIPFILSDPLRKICFVALIRGISQGKDYAGAIEFMGYGLDYFPPEERAAFEKGTLLFLFEVMFTSRLVTPITEILAMSRFASVLSADERADLQRRARILAIQVALTSHQYEQFYALMAAEGNPLSPAEITLRIDQAHNQEIQYLTQNRRFAESILKIETYFAGESDAEERKRRIAEVNEQHFSHLLATSAFDQTLRFIRSTLTKRDQAEQKDRFLKQLLDAVLIAKRFSYCSPIIGAITSQATRQSCYHQAMIVSFTSLAARVRWNPASPIVPRPLPASGAGAAAE